MVFLNNNQRLNADTYIALLHDKVFPWAQRRFGNTWTFIPDGAPAHTATKTQDFLKEAAPKFVDKHHWPPHSPDLMPLDYAVFRALKESMAGYVVINVPDLKDLVCAKWAALPETFVRTECAKFRGRLQACIDANGGFFEKKTKSHLTSSWHSRTSTLAQPSTSPMKQSTYL